MGKYEPLEGFLRTRDTREVPMTFAEIERVVGFQLPQAASDHRAWWSNNPSNNVMTRAWLAAGYESERVDMAGRRLVFVRRSQSRATPQGSTPPAGPTDRRGPGLIERLRQRIGGTFTVAPGVDLAQPVDSLWDAERD